MGNHLAHLFMSKLVLLANMASPRLEVLGLFFDQGCISVCGDALFYWLSQVERKSGYTDSTYHDVRLQSHDASISHLSQGAQQSSTLQSYLCFCLPRNWVPGTMVTRAGLAYARLVPEIFHNFHDLTPRRYCSPRCPGASGARTT